MKHFKALPIPRLSLLIVIYFPNVEFKYQCAMEAHLYFHFFNYISIQCYEANDFLLIKKSYNKSDCKFICCISYKALFSLEKSKDARYTYWRCNDMIKAVFFSFDNIFVRFGNKVIDRLKVSTLAPSVPL